MDTLGLLPSSLVKDIFISDDLMDDDDQTLSSIRKEYSSKYSDYTTVKTFLNNQM